MSQAIATTRNLVIIDSHVNDWQSLVADVSADSAVLILDASSDGLTQISDYLTRLSANSGAQNLVPFQSVHIISHGSAGSLLLGSSTVTGSNLGLYSKQLATLGHALTENGDILLYGCNVAAGQTGLQFINRFAALTDADVAASNDITGSAVLGGDWVLEAATGTIESSLPLSTTSLNSYTDILPTAGVITTDIGNDVGNSSADYGNSVTVQADGKILLAGTSDGRFALVRYNSNGSLDTSFSGDGKVTTDVGSDYDSGFSVTVQADGKILLGGYSSPSSVDFALVRYNPNGSLDTSFSGDGKVTTDLGSSDQGYSVTVQADGKILLGGSSNSNAPAFALVRYNTDGSLDTSFFGYATGTANSVIVQADGKILLGGYNRTLSNYSYHYNFAIERHNLDGSPDTGFSDDGYVETDLGSSNDYGYSVTMQADGKILLGGGSGGDFALVRYNTDGSLDASFSGDGKVTTDVGSDYDIGSSVTVQADGKILLGGYSNGNFALVRYNTDGSLDTDFSGDGIVTTAAGYGSSVTLQADGKILLGGTSGNDFALVRYNTDGSLDTTFNGLNHAPTGRVTLNDTTPVQNQILTVSNTLADADGLGAISYSWRANGLAVGTGATHTVTASDAGKAISVIARYTDLNGTAESVSSAATSIVPAAANRAPTGTVSINDTTPVQNQILTVSNTLADADGLGAIRYSWRANGSVVGTGSSHTVTAAEVGKTISVIAAYTDLRGHAESISSAATSAVTVSSTAGVTLQRLSVNSNTSEGNALVDGIEGNPVRYAVTLNTAPVANHSVTLNFRSNDTTEGTVTPSLTFSSSNWNQTQALVISGVDDLLNDGNIAYTVTPTVNQIRTDALEYLTITIPAISLLNMDDVEDTPINDGTSGNLGTDGVDYMQGNNGDDQLYGKYGYDELRGGYGNDSLYGEQGNDRLYGEAGNDTLYGGYQNDNLYGGAGNDTLWGEADVDYLEGGAGNDTLDGGTGLDTLVGGAGNDTYYLGYDALDVINDSGLPADVDTVIMPYQMTSYTLPLSIEKGTIAQGTQASSLTGNIGNNTLTGNDGANTLDGGVGADALITGAGNDTLIGGLGKDTLTGGLGADKFKFNAATETGNTATTGDIVGDFSRSQGDKIDLSAIDANTAVAGNSAFFSPMLGGAFSGIFTIPGKLYFDQVAHVLYGNNDTDNTADFSIQLNGVSSLATADFVL